jgi:hypothetical protein
MPASHSLETVFVRFNPFLMGDIFTGYLGTCVTPTVVQLGFAKLLLNAAPSQRGQRTHLPGHALGRGAGRMRSEMGQNRRSEAWRVISACPSTPDFPRAAQTVAKGS